VNLDELRKLARAATPGPWTDDCQYTKGNEPAWDWRHRRTRVLFKEGYGDIAYFCAGNRDDNDDQRDCAYIMSVSPDRVLALLDCVEAADAMRKILADHTFDQASAYDYARAKLDSLTKDTA
jgi:hypothetical protein